MRLVIQRTLTPAKVIVEKEIVGHIQKGLVVLVGIEPTDDDKDIEWLANKCVNMRIFSDDDGKMNLSVKDINGSMLVISQFTLHASTKKGNRPSYIKAAKPDFANGMYESFIEYLKSNCEMHVEKGVFGGDMKVELVNDGPVTIIIDSKQRE